MIFRLGHGNDLYSITTTADVYSAIEPNFFVTFKNTISFQQVQNFILGLFPDIKISEEVSVRQYGYLPIYDGYCATFTKNYFRTFVDKLYQKGILTAEEHSDIERHIIEFEQIIENRLLVIKDLNKTQEDIIKFMVAPYLEDFLSIEDQYVSLALMARSMLTCISSIGKDSDDLIFTKSKTLLQHIKTALPDAKQREAIYMSIGAIAKLSNGSQEMVSTFVRLGKNVPDKKIQRNIISKELYNAFNRKFNLDGQPELKLISFLAILGYNKHIDNINWNDPQQALATFIDSVNDKRNYESDMIFEYHQRELVSDIRNAMIVTGISFHELNCSKLISPEQLQELSCHVKKNRHG